MTWRKQAELVFCCGDPADCEEQCVERLDQLALDTIESPYFDAEGNEGTIDEVNS